MQFSTSAAGLPVGMTAIAVFTSTSASASAAVKASSAASVTSCTDENAQATGFAFVARASNTRSPCVLLVRTIAGMVSMLSMRFCAVPAFKRVGPAMNSGPTMTSMAMSASHPAAEAAFHATDTDVRSSAVPPGRGERVVASGNHADHL